MNQQKNKNFHENFLLAVPGGPGTLSLDAHNHMNPSKILLSLLFSAVLASSSFQSAPISQEDILQVTQIIKQGEDQPDQLIELFDDRRLHYSKDAKHLLSSMAACHQSRLFKRFFKFIDFEPESFDVALSKLLEVAIFVGNTEVCAFLLKQDFHYIRREREPWSLNDMIGTRFLVRPPGKLRSWDLEAFKDLIEDYPDIAPFICPQPYKHVGVENMLFLIEFAHHCAIISMDSDNPASFNPTAWINVIFQIDNQDERLDPVMGRLCELGAEVEQDLVVAVKKQPFVFLQTYRALRDRAIIDPAAPIFPVDANGVCKLSQANTMMLSGLLSRDEIPDAITDLLDGCRFAFSESINHLLQNANARKRSGSFVFFFERIKFEPIGKDQVMTNLLRQALAGSNDVIIHFLLAQDFRIRGGYALFFEWPGWNLERAMQLLRTYPQRGSEMSPPPQYMRLAGNAELAHLHINLAANCNPAEFNPSEFLAALMENRQLNDASMTAVIRRLCELGARVDQGIYRVFNLIHYGWVYPEALQALQEHEAMQDEIKEPDCD
jgi:hypothetical protein